jgi:hypothetical protein
MAKWLVVRRNASRLVVFSLAVLFVAFVAQATVHFHATGHDEAACQVCQAAHLGPVLQAGTLLLHAPLKATGHVEPFTAAFHEELFFHNCPSRAPPLA